MSALTYGLPRGTRITYGSPGFPSWVYALAEAFGLKASTYPGHQENDRAEAGYAPNPKFLNRGIDWSGDTSDMQKFAEYLFSVRFNLEQVIWENPNTDGRIGVAGGKDVTESSYYKYDGGYNKHRDHVHTRQSKPIPLPGGTVPAPTKPRPDFNEFPLWTKNHQPRGGTNIDAWFIHTQEGGGGNAAAEDLAKYAIATEKMASDKKISYHYYGSQASDGGVTIVDGVDTDYASWSVGNANNRSINFCFAGSRASQSRDVWMAKFGKVIDVAAYLAVQDSLKYKFSAKVIAPPYKDRLPGISDHNYVTKIIKWGSHTDVGPNFPWDHFDARVKYWVAQLTPGVVKPPVPPVNQPEQPWYKKMSDRDLLEYIARQMGPGEPDWPATEYGKNGKPLTFRDTEAKYNGKDL